MGTPLRSLPSVHPKTNPGKKRMGLGPPPDPIHPSAEPKESQKKPLKPHPKPWCPLWPLRLWAGFSCPRAVIVLIRSTGFDEGFTRKRKQGGRRR